MAKLHSFQNNSLVKRIDIIVPVYNVEKYLKRCLNSIKAQTYSGWRAICVDDGSSDGSAAILDEYAREDSRFLVIHKSNGGVSDARNVALELAEAEFVMFMDSDDLIHPQTMELALGLADRDGSDVVSWYIDRWYKKQIKLVKMFGGDPLAAKPWGYGRKYSLDRIKSAFTENLLAHCTELTHSDIIWPVKHFYVWRHLIRLEKIRGIKFVKGLNFEDFPWWSEVIMQDLKATITNLPLYFYYRYPNRPSIVTSSDEAEKIICFAKGLGYTSGIYRERATPAQQRTWGRNCKWPVITRQILKKLNRVDERSHDTIKPLLAELWNHGVFDDCESAAQFKARGKIKEYLSIEEP